MPESPSPDELAARIAIAEREIARLREELAVCSSDARAARTLASGADRDVAEVRAELRAHTRALNALRETQVEHGVAIDSLRTEIRAGFSKVAVGMQIITAKLDEALGQR